VVFRDPRNRFEGLDNYRTIFWSLRFHGAIFFKHLSVEVKRIWQKEDDSICMRWTVHGTSRLPWEPQGIFDGVSTYRLDSHGKVRSGGIAARVGRCQSLPSVPSLPLLSQIYEHKVDNVVLRDPPMARNPLGIRINLEAAPATQPLPGSWGLSKSVPATFISLYLAAVSLSLLTSRFAGPAPACAHSPSIAPQ